MKPMRILACVCGFPVGRSASAPLLRRRSRPISTTARTRQRSSARSTTPSTGTNMPAPGTISATTKPASGFRRPSPRATTTPTEVEGRDRRRGVGRCRRQHLLLRAGRHPRDRQGRQREGLCRLLHGAPRQPADPGAAVQRRCISRRAACRPSETAFEDAVPAQCAGCAGRPKRRMRCCEQAKAAFAATHADCEPDQAPEGERGAGLLRDPLPLQDGRRRASPMQRGAALPLLLFDAAPTTITPRLLSAQRTGRAARTAVRHARTRHPLCRRQSATARSRVGQHHRLSWPPTGWSTRSTTRQRSRSPRTANGAASAMRRRAALWIFRNGDFSLVKYEVDASYDGEINPETVLDYDTAP